MRKQEHWSTWYPGSKREWDAMPLDTRDRLAFEATGCLLAYPTWQAPADCFHVRCRIARGELPPIAQVNAVLRHEVSAGWLRVNTRNDNARICRAVRAQCRATGVYDAWKSSWQMIVAGALQV